MSRMGRLLYGAAERGYEIDDRALAHLRVAILTKLRRGESFALTLEHGHERGNGRTTMWLNEAIPIQFVFAGNRQPSLNRVWVDELLDTAHSMGGLQLVPEPRETEAMGSDSEP